MKNKILLLLFAVTLLTLNISLNKELPVQMDMDNYSLKNVQLLQSSAIEYNCSKTTSNPCKTFATSSTGVLTAYDWMNYFSILDSKGE